MENGILGAANRFKRSRDQILSALAEHLDRDIGGDAVLLDQAAGEVELDLRGRGEAHLDLLESDPNEHFEELELLFDTHRLSERLIAIAEVDAAPQGCLAQGSIWPLPMGQGHLGEGAVF